MTDAQLSKPPRDTAWTTLRLSLALLTAVGAPGAALAQHVAGVVPPLPQARRPFTPEDLTHLDQLSELDLTLSPDGQLVTFIRSPARSAVEIASARGGAPMRLLPPDGGRVAQNSSAWSPDGAHLALISVSGGHTGLWLWSRATKRLTKLCDGVDPTFGKLVWVGNRHLVAVIDTVAAPNLGYPGAGLRVWNAWQRAWEGRATTASILESGVPVDTARPPTQHLVLLDLMGKSRALAHADRIADPQPDPTGRYIAFVRQFAEVPPTTATPQSRLAGSTRLRYEIVDTAGHAALVQPTDLGSVDRLSFRWAAAGGEFAFFGRAGEAPDAPTRAFRGRVNGRVEAMSLPEGNPQRPVWAAGDRLLVAVAREIAHASAAPTTRLDWWLVASGAAPRNVTEALTAVPDNLVPDSTGRVFVGVASDDVWQFTLDTGAWTNLTAAFEPTISSIAWPNVDTSDRSYFVDAVGPGRVVVAARHDSVTDYYRVAIASGVVTPIGRQSGAAELAAYHPGTDAALFLADERTGTFLTLVRGAQRRTLVETNTFLRDVAEGQWQQIRYRSLDGPALTGWVRLPPNYQSGRRYPLVTWVYAGTVYKDTPPRYAAGLNSSSDDNLELLAARGYAVLLPSMPLAPGPDHNNGQGSDPYMELTKGVLPAVDKVIELGIADSTRLAVGGHSYGGYSTYGLVTQTTRFKAAIAMAGPSDLVSIYGAVSKPEDRYDLHPKTLLWQAVLTESGQGRMGNPPWKDWGRYWRNSPLFYVDRVQTPILIIQGDWDYVPIQQGEEFFTALYRQGKRARFVRYWGEGHYNESPANVRDKWGHIYRWLDDNLDLTRDATGSLVFTGDQVQARAAAPARTSADSATGANLH